MARIVAEQHHIPGSIRTRVAMSTLREWMRHYRAGGFDALKPKQRIDAGHPRALAPELVERLLQIKETDPDLAIRLVIEQARQQGAITQQQHLPVSTVHRLFKRHGLMSAGTAHGSGEDRRRFAYREAGQLWMSDVMHGPAVVSEGRGKHKVYLIAFLDDATRVIPHAEFAFSQNTRAFLPIFKRALIRRAIPQRLLVEYVPRHIFDHMWPVSLCGGGITKAQRTRRRSRLWTHNRQSDCSHFNSDGSSRQIARLGNSPAM
ncbi:MAG: helix-turn-helix domain-containing protein [Gammaproteobacteria bacterium]